MCRGVGVDLSAVKQCLTHGTQVMTYAYRVVDDHHCRHTLELTGLAAMLLLTEWYDGCLQVFLPGITNT